MFKLKDRYMHLNRKFASWVGICDVDLWDLRCSLSVDPEPVHACVLLRSGSPRLKCVALRRHPVFSR